MDVELKLKLRRIGNSLMVAIPSQVARDLQLKASDEMLLDLNGDRITIRKSPDTKKK